MRNHGRSATVIGMLAAGAWAGPASAGVWHVTNMSDNGAGSLRWAIEDSNLSAGSDTIYFSETARGVVNLTSPLTISGTVAIYGPGPGSASVSGGDAMRVFVLNPGASVTIDGLSIVNGRAPGGTGAYGGGIYANGASLTLRHCEVADCVTQAVTAAYGGGIYVASGSLALIDTTVRDCLATASTFAAGGGIAVNNSPVDFDGVSIVSNSSVAGTVVFGAVYLSSIGNASLLNSTFANNTLSAVFPASSALSAHSSSVTLTHCTVTGNSDAPAIGGGNGSAYTLSGSLIAANPGGNFEIGCSSEGGNLDSDGTSGLANGVQRDQVGAPGAPIDARLGELGSYGGPTPTIPLLADSPAIDAASPFQGPLRDQRGLARNIDGDCQDFDSPDIGAFEYGSGGGLALDGYDDYLVVANEASLNLTAGFTLEAWVEANAFTDDLGATTRILSNRSSGNLGFGFGQNNGRLMFTTFGSRDYIAENGFLNLHEWTHVAVVFDASADATFYINGAPAGFVSGRSPAALSPSAYLMIGRNPHPDKQSWNGVIDEVRMWNVVRTAEQIAASYDQSLAGNEPGLAAYWRFDEGAGVEAYDAVAGRLGAFSGAPYWMEGACAIVLCTGDTDHDGDIDLGDLAALIGSFGTLEGATFEDGDFDFDGDVDISDLAALISAFGTPCE